MESVQLQDLTVPRIGFGTWKLRGESCVEGVRDALDVGYRLIDTAQRYDNEEFVGQGLRTSSVAREDIVLCTKLWFDQTADVVMTTFEESLRKLATDYVDLLLLHWPNNEVPNAQTLGAMDELRRDGKVRAIGVSNFPTALVREAIEVAPIRVNEVEYHPYLRQRQVIDQARELDMAILAYAPLARGRILEDPVLAEIAAAHDRTPAQVTLRWFVQQPNVVAIPKSADPVRRRENFDVFDFELSDEEMGRIHARHDGGRLVDPDFGPTWDA